MSCLAILEKMNENWELLPLLTFTSDPKKNIPSFEKNNNYYSQNHKHYTWTQICTNFAMEQGTIFKPQPSTKMIQKGMKLNFKLAGKKILAKVDSWIDVTCHWSKIRLTAILTLHVQHPLWSNKSGKSLHHLLQLHLPFYGIFFLFFCRESEKILWQLSLIVVRLPP